MPGVKYFIKSNSSGNGKRLKLVDRSLYGGVFEIVHKGERREIVERPLLVVVFLDYGDLTKNRLGVDDHVVEVPLDGGALVVELDGGHGAEPLRHTPAAGRGGRFVQGRGRGR